MIGKNVRIQENGSRQAGNRFVVWDDCVEQSERNLMKYLAKGGVSFIGSNFI